MAAADQFQPNQNVTPRQESEDFPVNQTENQSVYASDAADLLPGPEPEYLVLEWYADSRYVRPRTRQYYSSQLVLVVLFSLLLFVANQIVLIALLWTFFFINLVLARVKPETVHVQITTYGIRYQDQLIFWDEISQFWIRDIHGFQQVHVEVPEKVFRQLVLLPSNASSAVQVGIQDIVELIGRVVPYQEPLPSRFDNLVEWLEQKFPLESEPIPAQTQQPVEPVSQPEQMSSQPQETPMQPQPPLSQSPGTQPSER